MYLNCKKHTENDAYHSQRNIVQVIDKQAFQLAFLFIFSMVFLSMHDARRR